MMVIMSKKDKRGPFSSICNEGGGRGVMQMSKPTDRGFVTMIQEVDEESIVEEPAKEESIGSRLRRPSIGVARSIINYQLSIIDQA